ncbi:hypothetical protein [Bacillus sp. NTK034]|uniref:hypothetical protein n=1 Tax=Bacillus sp. NTK034 TaxID=2802176 RepID=UPI001A8E5E3A|nr:hypothetical protein [Bacillus sp. NTK034]MBN8201069.1 hypothetical protein [Bacillus sp. NTK034]
MSELSMHSDRKGQIGVHGVRIRHAFNKKAKKITLPNSAAPLQPTIEFPHLQ